ncbi:MAG: hypothetical protein WDO16_00985 [Bacteroidota bacterium]
MRFSVPKMEFGSISAGQAHMGPVGTMTMIKGSDYFVSDKNEEF